jgi:hypothetical protein
MLVLPHRNQVRINSIEIIAHLGLKHESLIDPVELWVVRIQTFVGQQRDARGVLAECGEGVIEVIFAVEEGNVGRPEFFCLRALILNPSGNARQDIAASTPVMQVGGATNRQFAIPLRFGRSGKQIPIVAFFGDRRIVSSFDITGNADDPRQA